MSLKKEFISNIIFSLGTQFVSIVVSLIMTLGIPKALTVADYGYWQLFIFYTGFIGFFQFGLSDGLYLKYGGKNFNELNKEAIKAQLIYAFVFQAIISLGIIAAIILIRIEEPRFYILASFSIYIIIGNLMTVLGFLLLATNKIKEYSKSVLIEKISFLAILLLLYFKFKLTSGNLIALFLISKILSLLYLFLFYGDYLMIKLTKIKRAVLLLKFTIFNGIILMFSNIASTLILGVGRFVIDHEWGITQFGKVSLALSAAYFFLLFISQVSLSLFPVLRQLDYSNQQTILKNGSDIVGIGMLGMFIFYFPLVFILKYWIPQYVDSFKYLVILMPICLFEGKMQMINTTYIKSINKQKVLLYINASIFLLSVVLSFISGYKFHSILLILFSMLTCIAARCIITQVYLYKHFQVPVDFQIGIELLFTVIFICLVSYFDNLIAAASYAVLFIIYLLAIRKKFFNTVLYFVNRKKLSVI